MRAAPPIQTSELTAVRARSELDLADGIPEVLALDLSDLELERGGLARAVGAGEGARTPGGAYEGLRQYNI